jgi:PPOX class probable F420-dependent enzyme
MPGYGTSAGPEGLLSWDWAIERLTTSRNYWLSSRDPEGRPHLMPVWGMWLDESLWFSSANASRKARNLRRDPRCSMSTENPLEPVVLEGVAEVISDEADLLRLLTAENAKYETEYGPEMVDPAQNTCFRIRPRRVLGLDLADFEGSPTRWTFERGAVEGPAPLA